MARREGFEPPAFWSVGCLKGKSEPFRLRFVLFTAVYSADLPLFPPSPARFFRILGQKWVRENFEITKQKFSVCENVYLRKHLIQPMLIERQILSHSKTDNTAVSCNQMKHFRQLLHIYSLVALHIRLYFLSSLPAVFRATHFLVVKIIHNDRVPRLCPAVGQLVVHEGTAVFFRQPFRLILQTTEVASVSLVVDGVVQGEQVGIFLLDIV